MAMATTGKYEKREAQGRIEAVSRDGVRIDGEWWNLSRRVQVDLSPYKVGDGVYVCADETPDGERRFLTEIGPLQPRRPAPKPGEYSKPATIVDDLADDWPDDEPADEPAGLTRQQRLDCLRIAASVTTAWWTKKGADPDMAVLLGHADQLAEWLARPTRTAR
jgi:hypothetical protein